MSLRARELATVVIVVVDDQDVSTQKGRCAVREGGIHVTSSGVNSDRCDC